MIRLFRACAFTVLITAPALAAAGSTEPNGASSLRRPESGSPPTPTQNASAKSAPPLELPPLPDGVEDLNFAHFFRLPVGPRGLEITARLRELDGKRVRILGFMVREDLTPCNSCPVTFTKRKRARPAWMEFVVPGRMMFTPQPAFVSHAHYGLADDLPPQTLFVTVPDRFGELVSFTPGPMLLTGVLSIGNQPEADGRISVARLLLDLPAKTAAAALPLFLPTPAVNPTNP